MKLYKTDPEFMERYDNFIKEVKSEIDLESNTRYLAILATCLGSFSKEMFKEVLEEALDNNFSPIAAKELVYQAVDYLGIARVRAFLDITNEIMAAKGISLPLESQATTTLDNRLEKGVEVQATIFGEHMKEAYKVSTINQWLATNCFGDYYTRRGLDLAQREMITFCFLLAQGGCEPQLIGHVKGNMNMGNDKDFLMKVVLSIVPYIGYPRSLNAISAINKACE